MASTIKVDKIEGSTGSTITVPTGQTLTVTDGIPVASGGTGLASFTQGDILYATGATTLVKLAKGTGRQGLQTNSGATAPEWTDSPQSLMTAAGDVLYASGANTLAKLAKGSDDDVLTLASGVPSWAASAAGGKMGQMISTQLDVEQSTTSTTFVAITGVTNTITPAATSSKIWVQGNLFWGRSTNNTMWMQMFRDSTLINEQTFSTDSDTDSYYGSGVDSGYYLLKSAPFSFLDSPSTTSATVYTIKWRGDGNTLYLNRIGGGTNQAGTSQLNTIEVLA